MKQCLKLLFQTMENWILVKGWERFNPDIYISSAVTLDDLFFIHMNFTIIILTAIPNIRIFCIELRQVFDTKKSTQRSTSCLTVGVGKDVHPIFCLFFPLWKSNLKISEEMKEQLLTFCLFKIFRIYPSALITTFFFYMELFTIMRKCFSQIECILWNNSFFLVLTDERYKSARRSCIFIKKLREIF